MTGQIDLMLDPFFNNGWVWSEEANDWVYQPLVQQHRYTTVGVSDLSVSFDGEGYYSTEGLSEVDYNYRQVSKSESLINIRAYADTADAGDGGGGYAKLNMQITLNYPVYYRFEADVERVPVYYRVAFNGNAADAWYDAFGIYGGSFPPTYHYDNPLPDGWETYIDQGVLPAGTYDLSVEAYASLHRYGIGLDTGGTASLHLQMLGDVNGNGRVGIEDLNRVLTHWNRPNHKSEPHQGDLDGDGYVGINDLNMVLGGWGNDVKTPSTASAVSVPEPGGVLLLLSGSIFLDRRQRV